MPSVRIDSSGLRDLVNQYLTEYGTEVATVLEEAGKATAKDAVKKLKQGGSYNGGEKFNKGWTAKTETNRIGSSTTVYNSTQPGLAHLLEFGHAKRNGGRTKAFNFIAPVADQVEDVFAKEFEKALEK